MVSTDAAEPPIATARANTSSVSGVTLTFFAPSSAIECNGAALPSEPPDTVTRQGYRASSSATSQSGGDVTDASSLLPL
ncbi:MAG: hypothetical protein QM803_07480 [Rhodocyclaceae bacterium]